MDLQEYKKLGEDSSLGWDAITENCKKIYGDQEPEHYAPIIPKLLGGDEYLEEISIYTSEKQENHLHFVTYGFSQLHYDEERF